MNKAIALPFLVLIALMSGCASVPMASPEMDADAKKFVAPPGKSSIYVYRNETLGGALKMAVSLDGKIIGKTGPKTYFKLDVTPGTHELESHTENTSSLTVNAVAGKVHYIWQEVKMGFLTARSLLQEVSASQGQQGVNESNLALPDSGSSN